MTTSHFRFQPDSTPATDEAVEAWLAAGVGARPDCVERLVEFKHNKVYDRSRIFRFPGVGPGGTAVIAKHAASRTLFIEAFVYRDVLPKLSLPAPAYYAYVDGGMRSWLFMEEVVGEPFSPRSSIHTQLAVRWLATLHSGTSRLDLASKLPAERPEEYLKSLVSARDSIASSLDGLAPVATRTLGGLLKTLDKIERLWSDVCQFCAEMPHCLVHADFVNKNVVIIERNEGTQLIALDWGIAGWGAPGPDLEHLDARDYFVLVKPVWSNVRLADIANLKAVGVVMRHLGLAEVWASCLRDQPDWAMTRLTDSAVMLATALGDIRDTRA
jgi:phosphotransferase family enzyme